MGGLRAKGRNQEAALDRTVVRKAAVLKRFDDVRSPSGEVDHDAEAIFLFGLDFAQKKEESHVASAETHVNLVL